MFYFLALPTVNLLKREEAVENINDDTASELPRPRAAGNMDPVFETEKHELTQFDFKMAKLKPDIWFGAAVSWRILLGANLNFGGKYEIVTSVSVVEPNIFIIIFFICYLQYLIFFNNVVALNYCSDIFGKR